MSYCAPADLAARLSEADQAALAGDSGGETWSAPAVQEVLARVIADASAEVDGYVGAVRQLPLAAPHPLLKALTADLAACKLFERRGSPPEAWVEARKRVTRTLERIAEGKISLGAPEPEAPPAEPVSGVLGASPEPVFPAEWRRKFLG